MEKERNQLVLYLWSQWYVLISKKEELNLLYGVEPIQVVEI